MKRIAKFVKFLCRKNWHPPTALFELSDCGVDVVDEDGVLQGTRYVIVAFTPCAVDHLRPETTVFAATKSGRLYPGLGLDSGAEYERCRVKGPFDPWRALDLLGRYEMAGFPSFLFAKKVPYKEVTYLELE